MSEPITQIIALIGGVTGLLGGLALLYRALFPKTKVEERAEGAAGMKAMQETLNMASERQQQLEKDIKDKEAEWEKRLAEQDARILEQDAIIQNVDYEFIFRVHNLKDPVITRQVVRRITPEVKP